MARDPRMDAPHGNINAHVLPAGPTGSPRTSSAWCCAASCLPCASAAVPPPFAPSNPRHAGDVYATYCCAGHADVADACREEVFQYRIARSTNINKNVPLGTGSPMPCIAWL